MANQSNSQAIRLLPGRRLKLAFGLAIAADLLQMVAFPLFWMGGASPADDVVDVAVCVALTWLLGWHWEFAPSLIAELLPGFDLFPLWTLAIFSVYRKKRREAAAQLAAQQGRE